MSPTVPSQNSEQTPRPKRRLYQTGTCPQPSGAFSPIVLTLPELGEGQSYGDRIVLYEGTREAIRASGVVPAEVPFPGDLPDMKGSLFFDGDGRRYVLTKTSRKAVFNLAIHRFPNEIYAERERRQTEEQGPRAFCDATVALDVAEAAVADAERVLAQARSLRDSFADGARPDPGFEEVRELVAAASAQFKIGEKVRYVSEYVDDDEDGCLMKIVGEYRLRQIQDDNGPYIDCEGERVRYQWGYLARRVGTTAEFFYAAGNLADVDGKVGHIRLVAQH